MGGLEEVGERRRRRGGYFEDAVGRIVNNIWNAVVVASDEEENVGTERRMNGRRNGRKEVFEGELP